jgi:GH25 family lysozyme M1 (1,4-beta-N-acetylmuramidase)
MYADFGIEPVVQRLIWATGSVAAERETPNEAMANAMQKLQREIEKLQAETPELQLQVRVISRNDSYNSQSNAWIVTVTAEVF